MNSEHFSLTTGAIAEIIGARIDGRADIEITALGTLESGGPGSISFIRSERYARMWPASRVSAALVTDGLRVPGHDPETRALLVVKDADRALTRILETLAPEPDRPPPGVHPSAVVDPGADIGEGVAIGPHCLVGADTTIGDGSVLESGVTVAKGAAIGRACRLGPGVVLHERCVVGDGCIIHPNAVIGADGFGYRPAEDGRGVVKIPHAGNVVIGSAVEIGAGSTIDRAKFGSTTIGDGTKLDNLVHIAHGCRIGRACIICGHTGIGGSVVIGDGAMLGGKVGVADNVRIGAEARIGAGSGVMTDVPDGQTWLGTPAGPARRMLANLAAFKNLAEFMRERRRSGADA